MPVFGFYLQPAVGGRVLPYEFWRGFAGDRRTWSRSRSRRSIATRRSMSCARVAESGRADEIALYTGNDDNIMVDLLTPFRFGAPRCAFAGGLLGHWAVWTRKAVELLKRSPRGGRRDLARVAGARHRNHGRQRGVLRSGKPFSRLHRRHSRGTAAPGPARRALVPRSGGRLIARAGRRDRSRLPRLSAPERR